MKIKAVFGSVLGIMVLISASFAVAAEHQVPTAPKEYLDMKNPFTATPEVLEAGEKIYEKKCGKKCHGKKGDAKGSAVGEMEIKPKPFTDKAYMSKKSDGQLFWIAEKGSQNTDMDSFGPGSETNLSKDDLWKVIVYIRQFAK